MLTLSDVDNLCPLIDYGQQPMKVHTEVTLLYKFLYAPETMYPNNEISNNEM